jgi:hypothetical protein
VSEQKAQPTFQEPVDLKEALSNQAHAPLPKAYGSPAESSELEKQHEFAFRRNVQGASTIQVGTCAYIADLAPNATTDTNIQSQPWPKGMNLTDTSCEMLGQDEPHERPPNPIALLAGSFEFEEIKCFLNGDRSLVPENAVQEAKLNSLVACGTA